MLARQVRQAPVFEVEGLVAVVELGLAGQDGRNHGRDDDAGTEEGAAGAVAREAAGLSVSGRVARCAAAGSVGRYSGPRWPQPRAAALSARAIVLTRIWRALNIRKL
ncbi:hypothetical protein ALDI51_08940 [Alicycliphilus denitrificans]|nr:hypothetical protein ALDI51_08940 [Alicycliphilus denitrificans]